MNCLVSGATGFVGRQLCEYLIGQGEPVTALSLSGGSLADGSPTQALDLTGPGLITLSLAGIDVVYHLAGIAHRQAQAAAYRAVNYESTLRLAEHAAEQGVRHFVFLSSVKAMGPPADDHVRLEDDCTEPNDPYGLWKWRAECALRDAYSESDMSVVILRPTLVYGPGVKGNLALLAKGVRAGMPRPVALGGRSMVAVDDLVMLLHMLGRGNYPGVPTWIVSDGESYSTRRIYDAMRRALDRGQGGSWLPGWGWSLACALLDRLSPGSTDSNFDKLFGTELYGNAAVLEATSWRPRQRLEDVIPALLGASVESGGAR